MADNNSNQTNHCEYQPLIIQVAINIPLRRVFDYRLESSYPITPQAGMRVQVPFGKSTKIGIIHAIINSSPSDFESKTHKLKTIISILDTSPLTTDSLLSLYQWMCQYYHAAPGEIWQTLLPSALLKGKPALLSRQSRWLITQLGLSALDQNLIAKSAVKQRLMLNHLKQQPNGIFHDRLKDFNFSFANMKILAGKGWVERDYQLESSNNSTLINHSNNSISLTQEQSDAVNAVAKALGSYQSFLLFGVTASGKTEVYLRLVAQALEQQKQVLVLVPEIGLTPQILSRFKKRFNTEIVLLHSGMTDQQRLQSWLKAKIGEAKIIIGTRSALFTPMKNLGLIIIDEEHDLSFRQQQGFRYSARDVAMVRANFEKVPVLLGSASPSLETLMNVDKNKIYLLQLTQKAQSTQNLNYQVIDLKHQAINQGLSTELIKKIKKHLKQNNQVLLFLNRRGYAPVLLCHECGWSSTCTRCDIHFTYHHQNRYLQCHHCGSSRRAPTQCSQCQCRQMIPVGLGTERLHETIQGLFPEATTVRIDRDTTQRKSAMKDYVDAIKDGKVDILIGTQMLAKGHHFPNITLVALIDMDAALYSADFRATEYAAQLITQVSGRAGRADKPSEVLIQTHHANHPMLNQIIHDGYAAFSQTALKERVEAELPPYFFSALIQAESPQLDHVKQFLNNVREILDRYNDLKVELYGPVPAVYVKKAGKFRYQLFLQTNSRNQLHQLLELTLPDIESLKSANRVRWLIDIDPVGD